MLHAHRLLPVYEVRAAQGRSCLGLQRWIKIWKENILISTLFLVLGALLLLYCNAGLFSLFEIKTVWTDKVTSGRIKHMSVSRVELLRGALNPWQTVDKDIAGRSAFRPRHLILVSFVSGRILQLGPDTWMHLLTSRFLGCKYNCSSVAVVLLKCLH